MQKVVAASARAAHVKSAHLLGVLTRWAIWIFAILTALFQLGIAPGSYPDSCHGAGGCKVET
jgi:hypothetical protein